MNIAILAATACVPCDFCPLPAVGQEPSHPWGTVRWCWEHVGWAGLALLGYRMWGRL